jgi:hypothetical protein
MPQRRRSALVPEGGDGMQQVYSEAEVDFGQADHQMHWNWSGANNATVPPHYALEIGTITLNFFPASGGTLGRCDASGRDANGTAVWRVQIVYVEPQKTEHLPFPVPLRLGSGGHVEIGFTSNGPGTIFVTMNGRLV